MFIHIVIIRLGKEAETIRDGHFLQFPFLVEKGFELGLGLQP